MGATPSLPTLSSLWEESLVIFTEDQYHHQFSHLNTGTPQDIKCSESLHEQNCIIIIIIIIVVVVFVVVITLALVIVIS